MRLHFSNQQAPGSNTTTNMAVKAAMRKLLHQVLASGCLMLCITLSLAVGADVVFHPTGFAMYRVLMYPVIMANSLLQIEAFAPTAHPPRGPLLEVFACWSRAVRRKTRDAIKEGDRWVASFSALGALRTNSLVQQSQNRRRLSAIEAAGVEMLHSVRRRPISGAALLASMIQDASLPPEAHLSHESIGHRRLTQQDEETKPWERPGISVRFLEAFVRSHSITPDMTTIDVMERYIKPETSFRKCSYVELLMADDRCPSNWLDAPSHFVSHW